MSPSWRERIRVFFAAGRVSLVRYARGLKPRPGVRQEAACGHPASPAWEPALQQLDQLLAGAARADVTITLSNAFVRYVVLPPQPQILVPAELDAYAAFRMREVYGERVAGWALSVSTWDPGGGGVCAGMDGVLLQQLRDLAARHKCRFQGVIPYLSDSFDGWRKRFGGGHVRFALVEADRLCLASLAGGVWLGIRNQRVRSDMAEELLAALDQEAILHAPRGDDVEQVHLFAPEHPGLALPPDCGWRLVALPGDAFPVPLHYPSPPAPPEEAIECAV